jgi:hypothetical protein
MEDGSKSILVKVPLATWRRMKTAQSERVIHALRNKDHKRFRLDEMALEAIEAMYPVEDRFSEKTEEAA